MGEKRVALLFGNKTYQNDDFSNLESPHADVDAMAGVLQDPERGGFHDVQVHKDATRVDILRNLTQALQKKDRDDLLLIYFSGHGQTDDHGDLYLASVEAEKGLLTATAVDARHIAQEIGRADKGKTVLVLDCCHAGAFPSHFKSADVLQAKADAYADGAGCYVLMACDEFELAHDGSGESLSLLTHHIVEGLNGAADLDEDGNITVNELSDYLDRALRKGKQQKFNQSGHNQRGTVLLSRSGIEPLKVMLSKAEEQISAWRSNKVISLGRFNEVLSFIGDAPDGQVPETAKRFALIQKAAEGAIDPGDFVDQWVASKPPDPAPEVIIPELEPEPGPETEPKPKPKPEAIVVETALKPDPAPEPKPATPQFKSTNRPEPGSWKDLENRIADLDAGAPAASNKTRRKPNPTVKKTLAKLKVAQPAPSTPPSTLLEDTVAIGGVVLLVVFTGFLLSWAMRLLVVWLPDLHYGFSQPGLVVIGMSLVLCVTVSLTVAALFGEVYDFEDVMLFGGISLITLMPACLAFLWYFDTEPFCLIGVAWYDVIHLASPGENLRTDGARSYLIDQCRGK